MICTPQWKLISACSALVDAGSTHETSMAVPPAERALAVEKGPVDALAGRRYFCRLDGVSLAWAKENAYSQKSLEGCLVWKMNECSRFLFLPFLRKNWGIFIVDAWPFAQQCQMLATLCSLRMCVTAMIWHNISKHSYFCFLWSIWTFIPYLLPWTLTISLVTGQSNTAYIATWKLLLQNAHLTSSCTCAIRTNES